MVTSQIVLQDVCQMLTFKLSAIAGYHRVVVKVSKNLIQKFSPCFKSSCVASFGGRICNEVIHWSSGGLFHN